MQFVHTNHSHQFSQRQHVSIELRNIGKLNAFHLILCRGWRTYRICWYNCFYFVTFRPGHASRFHWRPWCSVLAASFYVRWFFLLQCVYVRSHVLCAQKCVPSISFPPSNGSTVNKCSSIWFIAIKLLLGVFCFRFICALLFYLLHLDNSEKEKRNSQKALNIPSLELTCTPV